MKNCPYSPGVLMENAVN